jgi:hypothetical protein
MYIGNFSQAVEESGRRMEKASPCGVEVSIAWSMYVGMIVSKKFIRYFGWNICRGGTGGRPKHKCEDNIEIHVD